MKSLKLALIAACVLASTSASAAVREAPQQSSAPKASTCFYEYSIITADAIYDVYTCYSTGDGNY
jgi:hypothetical protein